MSKLKYMLPVKKYIYLHFLACYPLYPISVGGNLPEKKFQIYLGL